MDLVNQLFDLFTDVPILPQSLDATGHEIPSRLFHVFRRVSTTPTGETDWVRHRNRGAFAYRGDPFWDIATVSREDTWIGAASLLLDAEFQRVQPLIVLEGAPGQGKSTISQYICQIHRGRMLGKTGLSAAASEHLESTLRLPFKVELRDFATWLLGGNPFGAYEDQSERIPPHPTLEGFLAAHVRYMSGGSTFDVSDLQGIFEYSSVLIVLDGLDEVADIIQRQRVVEEINAARH